MVDSMLDRENTWWKGEVAEEENKYSCKNGARW